MNTYSRAKLGILAVLVALTACGGGDSTNTSVGGGVSSATSFIDWTWVDGSESFSQPGSYGIKGTANLNNMPQALEGAVSWTDNIGNLWLFGGGGVVGSQDFNSLWKFDGTYWTWMNGTTTVNQQSVHGAFGVANPSYSPGARQYSAVWKDTTGNLWLFGGYVRTNVSPGDTDASNDMWKYDISINQWALMDGVVTTDTTIAQPGIYGSIGQASPANFPGARSKASSWVDLAGNFWLFGGEGYDSNGVFGELNDLWKFDGSNWIWISGSDTVDQAGSYGILNTSNVANVPGARQGAVSWIDGSDNLWLFGGFGMDSSGNFSILNDLWKFDGINWAWMSGSDVVGQSGNYGTAGSLGSGVPGARGFGVSWKDSSGNLWMFGGRGTDATGNFGELNDLWKFEPVNKQWAWMSGANAIDQLGIYGIKGVSDPANVPGARDVSVSWTNASGLWLFGGQGIDAYGSFGYLNDLWQFQQP